MSEASSQYASRAGDKLVAALEAFDIDVTGLVCADFGCNVGGFTDCLLQRGAAKVYAADTGYGTLAWPLRKDPRVVVMERTNALHCDVPAKVDLVTIDVAWTPQVLIVPAAMRWLREAPLPSCSPTAPLPGVISLLKPHYEMAKLSGGRNRGKRGRGQDRAEAMSPLQAAELCLDVCGRLAADGYTVVAAMRSPLIGKGGNQEFLLSLSRCLQKPGAGPRIEPQSNRP